jgi:hypothetical protein
LFGFRQEAAAFAEVDEVGGAFAIAVVEPDGFVVDGGVGALVLAGEGSGRDGQQVAQLVAKGLEVSPLGGRRGVAAADEIETRTLAGFRSRPPHWPITDIHSNHGSAND